MGASLLTLFLLVIAAAWLAARTIFPDAVVWCLAGFIAAFVPRFPSFHFDPQLALFLFLPPLVYAAAVDLPWPEFRDNLRPIGVLAIGLVLATAGAIAAFAHLAVGLNWSIALILGAIVSPTDPVAATAVALRGGMPRRLTAILEGEGLVNDAVSLTIFRLAVGAAILGRFSWGTNIGKFVLILVGEPAYGVLLGFAIAALRRKIADPRLEVALSLLTPFAAYLLPVSLGGSGILATVATGMYIGERRSTLVSAGTRLHATSFWQMMVFLLNGVLFVVAGIELKLLMMQAASSSALRFGLEIAAAVILLRFLWCFASWYLLRLSQRLFGRERHAMSFKHLVIVAWSGIRGPISLAAAMAIPAFLGAGSSSGYGDAVSVTAVVVVATLFVQGLSLPYLVRVLKVREETNREHRQMEKEEELGSREATRAALRRLSELEASGDLTNALSGRVRRYYKHRVGLASAVASDGAIHARFKHALAELLDAERLRIQQLRNQRRISDHVVQRLEHRLDLRQSLLD